MQQTPGRAPRLPQPVHVLVAEDEPDDRLLLQHAFRRAGVAASLHFAEDGQQAVDYLSGLPPFEDRTAFPLPALVLLDLKMPRMGGFEVLEWLRTQPSLHALPGVILSGSNLPQDIARARSLGAREYLVKPSNFPNLVLMVARLAKLWLPHPASPAPDEATAPGPELALQP